MAVFLDHDGITDGGMGGDNPLRMRASAIRSFSSRINISRAENRFFCSAQRGHSGGREDDSRQVVNK